MPRRAVREAALHRESRQGLCAYAAAHPKGIRQTAALPAGKPQSPPLHAKKYSDALDVWQARVTRDWRFYFRIESDEYVILSVIPHPK
jgi:hypothetical protein